VTGVERERGYLVYHRLSRARIAERLPPINVTADGGGKIARGAQTREG